MSHRIFTVLSEQFILRMKNWAWANSGGLASVPISNYCIFITNDGGYRDFNTPILTGEADDTGKALSKLDERHKQAVSLFWQYQGRPIAWFARRLKIDYRTYENRVIEGHELLKAEIARQHDQVTRYRESAEKNLQYG